MREGEFRKKFEIREAPRSGGIPHVRENAKCGNAEIRKLEIGHAKDAKVGEGGTQGFRD